MKYIWHCPSKECRKKGIILFKTENPFLLNGEIKCCNCNKIYNFYDVEEYNINNIKKYIKKLI